MNAPILTRIIGCILCSALGIALPAPASAQDSTAAPASLDDLGSDNSRPWAKGVSREHQARARQIFKEGNKLILQQFFKQAAEKYRDALDYWDHPAIHFNRSLALMNLDQPLELYHALEKSLEHGVPPLLDEVNHKRAENYLQLISQQVAHIVVVCPDEGAHLTLDDKPIFTGPGRYEGVVLAGDHTIRATLPGKVDAEKDVVISAGEHERVELKLFTRIELTVEQRLMSRWIPYALAAGGLALLGTGGYLHTTSSAGFTSFDEDFNVICDRREDNIRGCPEDQVPDELLGRLATSRTQQIIGQISYVAGGLAFTAGAVLLYLNLPKRIPKREMPEGYRTIKVSGVTITPVISPKTASVSARIDF